MKKLFILTILFVSFQLRAQIEIHPYIEENVAFYEVKEKYFVKQTEATWDEYLKFLYNIYFLTHAPDVRCYCLSNSYVKENYQNLPLSTFLPDSNKIKKSALRYFRELYKENLSAVDIEIIYKSFYEDTTDLKQKKIMLDSPVTGLQFDQVKKYLSIMQLVINDDLNSNKTENDGKNFYYYYAKMSSCYSFHKSNSNVFDKHRLLGVKVRLMSPEEYKFLLLTTFKQLSIYKLKKAHQRDFKKVSEIVYNDTVKFNFDSMVVEKLCKNWNYKSDWHCESNDSLNRKLGLETYPSAIFWANPFSIYDLKGNVAEMTSEKGVAKGGSYFHRAFESYPDAIQKYEGPENWLGFRYVVEELK